jgi:NADH-quinone oxidoreductase subunit G
MPTVEIDGKKIQVEDGLTVIQAAESLGVEIPHYCWHPGLSISGNCRMCLVEIEKSPKLQIACNTRVAEGMVVHTTSDKTKTAQKAVLEFLLLNHPIDCPVCDQAGECKLQEYYMDYDRQRSRMPLEAKVHKGKAIQIGPHVMLDQERCILCARCTRFCDEITKTSELGIFERGDHSRIELAPGKTLDNPYSMNVIDICPVGALTSKEFRFKARVWYLERTDSVCGACANGCNIDMYHREGRLFRFQPRANPDVNGYWMCDAGRLSWGALQGEGRLFEVLVRGDAEFAPAEWPTALAVVSERLQGVARTQGAGAVGIAVSARASNEEVFQARRLGAALGATVAGVSWSPPGAFADDFLIKADKNPNTQGLALQGLGTDVAGVERLLAAVEAGTVKALVLVRSDLTRWLDATRVRQALERVEYLVVLDSDGTETAQFANVVLPIATYAESDGTFTNHAGRVQRFRQAIAEPGQSRPGWRVLADLVAATAGTSAPADAAATFAALAAEGGAFAGLDYERVGEQGVTAANARASD